MNQFLLTNQLFPSNISSGGKSYGYGGNIKVPSQQISILTPENNSKSVNIFETSEETDKTSIVKSNIPTNSNLTATASDEVVCSNNNAIIIFLIIIIVIILITIILMSIKLINYGNRPIGFPTNGNYSVYKLNPSNNYPQNYYPNSSLTNIL